MAEGQYKFGIGLDTRLLQVNINEAKKMFEGLTLAANKVGSGIDSSFVQPLVRASDQLNAIPAQTSQITQSFNGLNMATQQLVRELPAASMGINTFFVAISNNLPIFADQVKRVIEVNKELAAQGLPVKSAAQQILSSLLSWQTALIAGVTALSMYGKEIANWVSGLFSAEKQMSAAQRRAEALNEQLRANISPVAEQVTQLNILRSQWAKLGEDIAEKTRFIDANKEAFDKLGVSITNVNEAQRVLVDDTDKFEAALMARAKATAAYNLMVQTQEELLVAQMNPAYSAAWDANFLWIRTQGEAQVKAFGEMYEKFNAEVEAIFAGLGVKSADTDTDTDTGASDALRERLEAESARVQEDAARATAEANIKAMKDGLRKELAEIQLGYEQKSEEIAKREEELRKLRGGYLTRQEVEAINALKNANDAERNAAVAAVYDDMWAEADKFIEEADGEAAEASDALKDILNGRAEAWEDYHIKFGTIKEQILATTERYERRIAEAETEGERRILEAERDAILARYEVETSAWAKTLVDKTAAQLNDMIGQLEQQLKAEEEAYSALDSSTSDDAEQYRQRINELTAQIAHLKTLLSNASEAVKDDNWGEAAQVFHDIAVAANDTANKLEGVNDGLAYTLKSFGQIASAAGSLVSAIGAVTAAAGALNTALGVIGLIAAAINAVLTVFTMLKDDYGIEETTRQFFELNTELARTRELARIDSREGTIFGKDPFGNFVNNVQVMRDAADALAEAQENIRRRYTNFEELAFDKLAPGDQPTKHWGGPGTDTYYRYADLSKAIATMQVKTRDRSKFAEAFGAEDEYANLGALFPGLFDEEGEVTLDGLQHLKESDIWGKLSQKNRDLIDELIAGWEQYEEATEAVKAYLTDIFGELSSDITDALVDAFANGTDAAQAFSDSVSDILRNFASDMVQSMYIGPLLEQAQADVEAIWADKTMSHEQKLAAIAARMAQLGRELNDVEDDVNASLTEIDKSTKKEGFDIFDGADRQGSSKGIAQASQESINELNGRATAIQSHTYAIARSQEQLTRDTAAILRHLAGIEHNTGELTAMRNDMAAMRSDISTIATRGVIMR